jgi:uncharacterized protein (DUF305 family)
VIRPAVVLLACLAATVGVACSADDGGEDGRSPDAGPPDTLAATDADIGFLQDMFDHHGQAVLLGTVAARRGDDERVRSLGLEIAVAQAGERGEMQAMLRDRGAGPGSGDRLAMGWAHDPVPITEMPGMIPSGDLAAVQQLSGAELDRRFLELMIAHHEGGITMAEHGRRHAADPVVVELAARMASDQQRELSELLQLAG